MVVVTSPGGFLKTEDWRRKAAEGIARRTSNCRWIRAWGDPHITTLDGVRYAFNGLGEFVVVDVDNGEHQVQGRTCFAKGSSHATVFCAIATAQKNHSGIQVNLEGESGVGVYVNNSAVNMTLSEEEDFELEVDDTAVLTRPANNSILIVFFSGITVKVTANKAMLFMEFSAPEEYMNKTRGLLGRWDGDTSNDFEFFNGTLLPPKSSERNIFEMGSSWQVTDGDGPKKSIFQYKPGEDSSNSTSAGFIPKFTDELDFGDPDLEEEAREVCGNDTSCLFDVAETGDIEVGRLAEAEEQNFENSVFARDTFPPLISGPDAVYVNLGDVVEIQVNVSDPAGLNLTIETGDEVPADVSVSFNGDDVTLLWNVTSDEIFNLQLVATNTENSSAEYWPVVYMCSCRNNGSCNTSNSMDPSLVSDDKRFVIMDCVCQDGYTGQQCETDIDACAANFDPCFPGVNCTDLTPPADVDGYECGECPVGYEGNGTICQDVDECETDEGLLCQHTCINNIGNFTCGCHPGYHLLENGFNCSDIDECAMPNNCSQLCDNTDGSYNCSCWDGFSLDTDGQSCQPNNPCEGGTDPGCDPVGGWCMVNETGTAVCVCEAGYELANDSVTCLDKDECELGERHCHQLCNNTVGGYTCYCEDGYELPDDPSQLCKDIPEMTPPAMSTEPSSTASRQTQTDETHTDGVTAVTDGVTAVTDGVTVVTSVASQSIAGPITEQHVAGNTTTIVISVLSASAMLAVVALIFWRMSTRVKSVQLSGKHYPGSTDELVVNKIRMSETVEMKKM
ncbi:mucin-like protein [Branchiostoma floridae]|uniref:Mucin-like protein n=1 Tax=Branchiostoma floridae TaxID=7739 RepID=A0A9J7LPW0_BRAFL|nr:mucin-like protein [Branchiostoma floridae]